MEFYGLRIPGNPQVEVVKPLWVILCHEVHTETEFSDLCYSPDYRLALPEMPHHCPLLPLIGKHDCQR